jgi:hypothetical protein
MAETETTTTTNTGAETGNGNGTVQQTETKQTAVETGTGGAKEMPAGFEGGAEAWAKLDDAGKQTALDKGAGKGTETKDVDKKDAKGTDKPGDAAAVDYAKTISEVELPDGMKIDEAAVAPAVEIFTKHNLPAEVVKDLVSLYAQQTKAGADGNAKAFTDQVQGWKASAEKETTPEERGTAKEAALKVFGKDEVALLELFGVTNRAGFIKSMAKIGKMAIGDDTFVPGNAKGDGSRDARSQFPNSNMNP